MTRAARTALRLVLGACALAGLASCGEEESKEEDRIADVIRSAATSTDPGHCTRLLTRRFVEQTELKKGAEAIRACRRDAKDAADDPRSVKVSKIDVADAGASATAAFRGGDSDGQTLNLILIKQGDRWKLDYVESFARFHREKFLKAIRRSLVRPPGAVPAETANCIARRLDRLSDRRIQRLAIDANQLELFILFRPCFQAREIERSGGRAAQGPRPEAPAPRRTEA